MTKAPIDLQELRRKIYAQAKSEPTWRFWGLYVHVCKMETLRAAYALAKHNDGAPGIDGITFEAIEKSGAADFLEQIRDELISGTYRPLRNRKQEIPKGNGKVRVLGIPTIRDRVVQGALKLILEPIFEADFQPGSYGYRPGRTAHQAVGRVAREIAYHKTRILDVDLKAFFDNVRHDLLLAKVAKRVDDPEVMRLLKLILTASGKKGVPQGGVISPLLSNIYLNEVDRMLERAKQVTFDGHTHVEYVRYADDLVVLVNGFARNDWLLGAVNRRLREELAKLHVEVNEEKSRNVDLAKGDSFGYLGFDFRRVKSLKGKWRPHFTPKMKKRSMLLAELKAIFHQKRSRPPAEIVTCINPILRGWVNYFAIGNSTRCFSYVRRWVELKMRRHLMRARKRRGLGWKRWSSRDLHQGLGIFNDYQVRAAERLNLAAPAR
jgi:RNA-directed DNA polymerase